MAKKTVGTVTLSSSGGSIIGVAVATILDGLLPVGQSPEMFGAIAVVCSAVFAVLGGYLSPVQGGSVTPYLDQAIEGNAQRVATRAPTAQVPSALGVAEAVAERGATKTNGAALGRGSYVGQHASSESAPAAVELGLDATSNQTEATDDYPDLDSMARVDNV